MTPEQITSSLSPGAARAVMGMTMEVLVSPCLGCGGTVFAQCWGPECVLCDKSPAEIYLERHPLGQQVKDALLKIEQETK